MDERNIEFGTREALGLPDDLIEMCDPIGRFAEAFDHFSRILEEVSLADLYAACYDAAAEAIKSSPGWVRPESKPPPPVGRSQPWIRVVQRTVKAGGQLIAHP